VSYQPTNIIGLRVPLFDRLVDSAPDQPKEVSPLRVYTKPSLYASMARDIGRLLNTRRGSKRAFSLSTASVMEYGLPSFSHLSPASATDRRMMAESVRETITFFEPRALNVSVQLEPNPDQPSSVLGYIHCEVRLGSLTEPVTFPLVVENRTGVIEVLTSDSNVSETQQTS